MNCAASVATCRTTTWRASPIRSSARRPPTSARAACRLPAEVMRWLFSGKGMLSYSPSIVAASVKVLEEFGDARHADHLRARQLQGRPDRRTRGDARPQRRRMADAAVVARLCRGEVEPARRHAGDQPALPVGRDRPARHHRRAAICPADLRRTRAEAVRPGRKACPAPCRRPTTSCSITRGATAAPAITPAAPA